MGYSHAGSQSVTRASELNGQKGGFPTSVQPVRHLTWCSAIVVILLLTQIFPAALINRFFIQPPSADHSSSRCAR